MKLKRGRILSWLLLVAMVLSLLPAAAFAEETTAWSQIAFADITAEDTVAITMTDAEGITYVLPTVATGSNGQPMAETVTVTGNVLTTAAGAFQSSRSDTSILHFES